CRKAAMVTEQTCCNLTGTGNEWCRCCLTRQSLPHHIDLPSNQWIMNQRRFLLANNTFFTTFAVGKSFTTSSSRIPQGGNTARVSRCSGAIKVAYPFFIPYTKPINDTCISTQVYLSLHPIIEVA